MKKEKKEMAEWKQHVIAAIITAVLTFLFIMFVGQRCTDSGESMLPTINDKDVLCLNKIIYKLTDPKRFDIVVFRYSEKEYYVKRIIALPGETIWIDYNGLVYVNGEVLDYPYKKEQIQNPGIAYQEITLGEDEYFCMGDNVNNSHDSRFEDVGPVKRSSILGRVKLRILPLDNFGLLE